MSLIHRNSGSRVIPLSGSNLQNISMFMEDDFNRVFFNHYFDDYTIAETTIMMMKIYEFARKRYPRYKPRQIVGVVRAIMADGTLRANAVDQMMQWKGKTTPANTPRIVQE